jgi:cyclophilin family peptidyl-prolyl cis-trans isomerase/HEAT repeat protein
MPVRRWGVLILLAVACATSPARPPTTDFAAVERARIAELELARDTRGDVLVSRARLHADPSVRARALVALGRIQDLSTAPTVAEALTDSEPRVRAAAAFAAGVLALAWEPVPDETRTLLGRALIQAETKENDGAARLMEIDALGRVRTPATLEKLMTLLAVPTGQRVDETDPRTEVPVRAAIALGAAARAKAPVPASSREGLERLSGALLAPYRWAGVYGLAQMKLPAARPALLRALRDDDPEVRAMATKGVSDVVLPEDGPALKAVLRDDDGRVSAEAVRGLVTLAGKCTPGPCFAADALGELDVRVSSLGAANLGQAVPPLLALAQAPVPESARRVLVRLRNSLKTASETAPDAVRATVAWLDCRLAAAEDRQRGWLDEVLRCGHGRVPDVRRLRLGLEAVSTSPRLAEARVEKPLLPLLRHYSPQVRAAAAGVVPGAKAPDLLPALRFLLQDPDLIVRASAVDALTTLGDPASGSGILAGARTATVDVVSTYAEALIKLKPEGSVTVARQWLAAPHAHVRHEGARVLTALEGTQVRAPALPAKAEAPPAPAIPPGTQWRIETAHGPVVIAPELDGAPATVAQLSRLARDGYFKGLTFHRVVPDFVVQGGDPRGDGEGGPGFSIPCEVSPRPYVRGTVGMALAGKDTGGSQIFVALSPQPHLDARYTIIGTVVSGMEALDGMVEGDPLADWVVLAP